VLASFFAHVHLTQHATQSIKTMFHPILASTSFSRVNVRLAFESAQVLLTSPAATVCQLKLQLAHAHVGSFPPSEQLRVVRKGSLLKDSTVLADGDSVSVLFPCVGGSTCVHSLVTSHIPLTLRGDHHDSPFCEEDEESDACLGLGSRVRCMKTLRRLQSSEPKSSSKLFGNRSNLLLSDYADLMLGFVPPKLRAKVAKTSLEVKQELSADEFQGELAVGQHRGVVESAAGKNFRVRSLLDNRLRNCRKKGHLKRHIQINSVVVFEPAAKFCDDEHGDIVWRYFEKEVEQLQGDGLLPESHVLWPNSSAADARTARCFKTTPAPKAT
jgi:translation initiation factor IF-1